MYASICVYIYIYMCMHLIVNPTSPLGDRWFRGGFLCSVLLLIQSFDPVNPPNPSREGFTLPISLPVVLDPLPRGSLAGLFLAPWRFWARPVFGSIFGCLFGRFLLGFGIHFGVTFRSGSASAAHLELPTAPLKKRAPLQPERDFRPLALPRYTQNGPKTAPKELPFWTHFRHRF